MKYVIMWNDRKSVIYADTVEISPDGGIAFYNNGIREISFRSGWQKVVTEKDSRASSQTNQAIEDASWSLLG